MSRLEMVFVCEMQPTVVDYFDCAGTWLSEDRPFVAVREINAV